MDGTFPYDGTLTSLEVCAGAGGQALGLEAVGFRHLALAEIDEHAQQTLRLNRPGWNVLTGDQADIRTMDARPYRGVDLLAGGLPCPPFSIAGKQLGEKDERNLFPDFIRLVDECEPRAILIENVKGMLGPSFQDFRENLAKEFDKRGFALHLKLLNASDHGVCQLRPRVAIVGLQRDCAPLFRWPDPVTDETVTVGELLKGLMGANGWKGVGPWARKASAIAPTLVGGSKKHGGPDLGPTRAREAWKKLGVNGSSLAETAPEPDFEGLPRLTVAMAAKIQGFPDDWQFAGRKTAAYRQVGNAFPPPVAKALGEGIARVLTAQSVSSR